MENLRRRTEREVADARIYGVTNFARDILAVADNMERAMKALDDEIREKADAGVKALLDGLELTERELIKVMEKHGVKKIEPQGQKFDPNLHQAMFEIPDPERAGRHRRADHAARLHHRRARAAARAGRRIQGRAESAAGRSAGERQFRRRHGLVLARLDAVADRAQPREHIVPCGFPHDREHLQIAVLPEAKPLHRGDIGAR